MATETKSVFLYGKPTKTKRLQIMEIESLYREHINFFIEKLLADEKYYLAILNNNKKSPLIRELEKNNRTALGSALGQNAIDYAVKELHNHFIRIKNYLYGVTIDTDTNYFVSSIALLNASIQGISPKDTLALIEELLLKAKDKKLIAFYQEIIALFNKHTDDEVKVIMETVKAMFVEQIENRKVPDLNKVAIQLDSRLCTIEKANNIKADYVISIKTLERGKRIDIPIKTSSNGLRRLNQYGMKSPTIKLTKNGIKVTIPFDKKVKTKSKESKLVGIDLGITDLIYTSNNSSYGSYSKVTQFYDKKVLPEDKKLNNLRNLMKKYQKELRNKNTHPIRKEYLRKKICHINTMIQQNKKANRIRRSYKHLQEVELSNSIKSYFKEIKGTGTTTVIEDINIIEFDRGKKNNRRDSMWARGKLHRKLEELLSWHGYKVIKIDPAYTSKLCPICNNIDNDNRNGKNFKCTCCGHTTDADYNASINIRNRAFDTEVFDIVEKYKYSTKKRHTALKELYEERHKTYINTVA